MDKKYLTVLIMILFIGSFLRVVNISSNPPAIYGDELTILYDAYSLLKTGHDQLGNFLPLTFAMGEGRPAGYVYGSIPFVAFFGTTPLAVRSLSVLSGVALIFLIFIIGLRLFSPKVGLAAAAIFAISPWDISLSRGGFEAHFALLLAVSGLVLYMLAEKRPWLILLSAAFFGVTVHTYPTYKLSLPLFIIIMVVFIRYKMNHLRNNLPLAALISLLFILIVTSLTVENFLSNSEKRFSNINVFSLPDLKEQVVQKVNTQININTLPGSIAKLFHNKPIEYSGLLIENYFSNFSLDFLFFKGDENPRHNMANVGGLYLIELFLILAGSVSLWYSERSKLYFLWLWILIVPLPTTLLLDPHFLRSSFMLPPLIFLSAYGLSSILNLSQKKYWPLKLALILGFVIQFVFFAEKLYFLSPNKYAQFWSYPAKQASILAMESKDKYDDIILSTRIDNIEYAYPVYQSLDPNLVIQQNRQGVILGKYKFKKFDNVYLGSIPVEEIEGFLDNMGGSYLYVGTENDAKSLSGYSLEREKFETPPLLLKKKE